MGKNVKDSIQLTPVGSWKRMLEARPVKNVAAKVHEDEHHTVQIEVKKRRPGWLVAPISWVIRPRTKRTVALDQLGSEIWHLCDGQRTVEHIIDRFAKTYQLSFHEARVSVTDYLKSLVQRGIIAMVAPKE